MVALRDFAAGEIVLRIPESVSFLTGSSHSMVSVGQGLRYRSVLCCVPLYLALRAKIATTLYDWF